MVPPKFNPNAGTFIPGQYQPELTGPNRSPFPVQKKPVSYEEFLKQKGSLNRVASPKPSNHGSNSQSALATPALSSEATSGMSTPISRAASVASLSSLNSALSKLQVTPISDNLEALKSSSQISEIRCAIDGIVDLIQNEGISAIIEWNIADVLKSLSRPKNPPLVREGSMLLLSSLSRHYAGQVPFEAYFAPLLQFAFECLSDKERSVVRAAQSAIDSIYGMYPTEALPSVVLPELLRYLKSSAKWTSKVACLKTFDNLIKDSPNDLLEMTFVDVVPVLTDVATDFKPELAKVGLKTLNEFVKVLDNLDLVTRFDMIVDTLADPRKVPACIKSLSSVTFVAEVTEPALALLVPVLDMSLKLSSSSQEQLRQSVIVTENLTRLVNNKREIESYIPTLLPGIKKVIATASLPEVRELAAKALAVLQDAEAEQSDGKFHGRISLERTAEYLSELKGLINDDIIFNYMTTVVAADSNVNDWKALKEYLLMACIPYVEDKETRDQIVENIVLKLRQLFTPDAVVSQNDDGIEIVNTDFSLAYGSRMLLNKTTLRLLKGHRYGLCGRNGAGKSTLMRSIANGQLEGFPDPSVLKTCFVEHKLQGSEADMDLVAFIASDPELASVSREDISKALNEVGFNEERRSQHVGSLSGGWKMKLELARAMLMKADILLLDEPTNHLDVANVKWLQDYLLEHTDITSLIVSHDSGFLDSVCTDIIHYENKKLAYYKGNLSDFVKAKPEGKAYYTLTDSNVKMAFPPPGILTGVKSNTRSVAKMTNVTFTYPGAEKPSLSNVSCSLSLSSRVAVLGPNGAGKSTLIKLLTGELIPKEGKVEKHPNLRIGYIAQHALQHVEQHKEKTANQYLQWRYKFGDDREVLLKESRKISDEEKQIMEKEIDIDDGRGMRQIEAIVGRQKLKKSFQYEIKWKFWLPKYNSWVSRERLIDEGFDKLVQKFDDHEASREGLGYRELTPKVISKHFEDVGLDADIADHTPMGSLSGGQLVKVVIAGAMWNNPHLLVLDEPTNYLDRDSLGGLAVAIRDWTGGVVMISHNNEFVGALCPEQWIVENGTMVTKGIQEIDQGRFEDGGKNGSTVVAAAKTAAQKAKDDDSPANIKVKQRKKKMTRNEKKAQEERRRLRHIEWLSSPKGTPKPVNTDDEED
ncbi:BA75_03815T0 [Komagataella pastoris]|uniref:BA75_03815T0 n=1 Tax=Komagataella pastoris TaxID=4922 RepID=A0A1B2JFP6_PICPA|nr:BA75_03815T0 [Komagataella pastoris]